MLKKTVPEHLLSPATVPTAPKLAIHTLTGPPAKALSTPMTVLNTVGRTTWFLTKYITSMVVMLLIGLAQAPALFWYVLQATPECGQALSPAQTTAALTGIVLVAVATFTLAIVLGVRFLKLRWGWLLWWIVPAAALVGPIIAWKFLPVLSPGTGGLFCL